MEFLTTHLNDCLVLQCTRDILFDVDFKITDEIGVRVVRDHRLVLRVVGEPCQRLPTWRYLIRPFQDGNQTGQPASSTELKDFLSCTELRGVSLEIRCEGSSRVPAVKLSASFVTGLGVTQQTHR